MCYKANPDKLEEIIGDTPYGRFLIEEFRSRDEYLMKHPGRIEFHDSDWLHEIIGVVKAYDKLFDGISQEALETPNKTKIEICKKALKAIKDLENTDINTKNE